MACPLADNTHNSYSYSSNTAYNKANDEKSYYGFTNSDVTDKHRGRSPSLVLNDILAVHTKPLADSQEHEYEHHCTQASKSALDVVCGEKIDTKPSDK
jgi:hypothetical protein